jgi:hypothetical protein
MKEFKIKAITETGEKALSKLLTERDIKIIIPFALKKGKAVQGIDYKIEVVY